MGRHTHSMLLLSLLTLNAARAHEHDEELTRRRPTQPSTRSSGSTSSSKPPSGHPLPYWHGIRSHVSWHVPLQVCPHPRPRLPPFILLPFLPHLFIHLIVLRPVPYHDFTLANPSPLIVGCGIALTLGGYILGHHTVVDNSFERPWQVRQYHPHTDCGAACAGVYLKLHIHERTLRPLAVRVHGIIGKSYPVLDGSRCSLAQSHSRVLS